MDRNGNKMICLRRIFGSIDIVDTNLSIEIFQEIQIE